MCGWVSVKCVCVRMGFCQVSLCVDEFLLVSLCEDGFLSSEFV